MGCSQSKSDAVSIDQVRIDNKLPRVRLLPRPLKTIPAPCETEAVSIVDSVDESSRNHCHSAQEAEPASSSLDLNVQGTTQKVPSDAGNVSDINGGENSAIKLDGGESPREFGALNAQAALTSRDLNVQGTTPKVLSDAGNVGDINGGEDSAIKSGGGESSRESDALNTQAALASRDMNVQGITLNVPSDAGSVGDINGNEDSAIKSGDGESPRARNGYDSMCVGMTPMY
eukprot:scaffold60286_cov24-Tisochrysis_lutea.AAC.2